MRSKVLSISIVVFTLFLASSGVTHVLGVDSIRLIPDMVVPGEQFGYSLAVNGSFLIIGAPGNQDVPGAAYVFRKSGGQWVQQQRLSASNSHSHDEFGASVAINGDTLVVGRARGGFSASAEAIVYQFDGSSWVEAQQLLTPYSTLEADVAIHDDFIALLSNSTSTVVIYERIGGTWELIQTLQPLSGIGGPTSRSLSMDADRLAVGTNGRTTIYRRVGSSWSQEAVLTMPGLPSIADFGLPNALHGDDLLVAATGENGVGAVYWFRWASGSWSLHQQILPPHGVGAQSAFGHGVAISESGAVVGAPGDDGANGTAWGYQLCGDFLQPENRMMPTTQQFGLLGHSVAMNESEIFAGSPRESYDLLNGNGVVYVYPRNVDCNSNHQPDGCELSEASGADCNHNLILDGCESANDCNNNGVQDFCDLTEQLSQDCNINGVPDECDLASGNSIDADEDEIPDECFAIACEGPQTPPTMAIMAVGLNGVRRPPVHSISIRGHEIIDIDVKLRCFGEVFDKLDVYQFGLDLKNIGEAGSHGRLLPLGWDAGDGFDNCPCSDPAYPVCSEVGCVGPDHNPNEGLFIDTTREDFLFYELNAIVGVARFPLDGIRFGGTPFDDQGAPDSDLARYLGTIRLQPAVGACGTFEINLEADAVPHEGSCTDQLTFLMQGFGPGEVGHSYCPAVEPLRIHVCTDDGLFCNGLESCDAEIGCQITPPPSCDDGVACTVDACDELTDGCSHSLNHAACDDGNICTRDECTPTGCVNIDDQCGDIPTTSNWGLVILALSFLIMAKWRSIRSARN